MGGRDADGAAEPPAAPYDPTAPLERIRRIGVVARGELRRAGGSFNPKTLVAIGILVLLMGLVSPLVAEAGFDFDHGLYRIVVDDGSPLQPAVAAAPVFQIVSDAPGDDPRAWIVSDEADLVVSDLRVYATGTDKGRAALSALDQAVKDHTFALMAQEPDQAAAFPVRVELVYLEQERPLGGPGGVPTTEGLPEDTTSEETDETEASTGGSGGDETTRDESLPVGDDREKGFSFLPPERSVNTPESLAPPFPFRSLLLAYLFLLPMNFVVQVYAGSIIQERLGRKGEALLASPASPGEIIIGKTLPYFVLMLLISLGITIWIGAGWVTMLATVPLILIFLAMEFIAAMYARSFRELTFVTVFASVLLTMYAFLPAAFTEVHPVALVSPISLVVLDLRDSAFTLAEFLYATLPLTLVGAVLFMLGRALFTEEDLFHQKPVFAKAVDSVARQVKGMGSGFRLSVLFIPFVFVAELMLVAFLFAWPVPVGLVAILLVVALVEELFKGLPSYAASSRGLVPYKRMLLFGALVGLGFFVAEKAFLVASYAGLYDIDAGQSVFGTAGTTVFQAGGWWIVALLLAAPLLLHVLTAMITALGARHGRKAFLGAFVVAVSVHLVYNLAAIRFMSGVGGA